MKEQLDKEAEERKEREANPEEFKSSINAAGTRRRRNRADEGAGFASRGNNNNPTN